MNLAMGDGNVANNNVVVYGGVGDEHGGGGFSWEADNEGVWIFENNLAHSNHCGLRVWQNTSKNHTIINFDSYNNFLGIFHGAYTNSYTYRGGYHYNSPLEQKAASGNSSGVRYENLTFDGAGKLPYVVRVMPSPVPSFENHDLFLKCTFKNYTGAAVRMDTFPISNETVRKHVDIALCSFTGKQTEFTAESTGGSFFRIQPASGQAVKIDKSGSAVNIDPYISTLWGTGTGLMGNYYNGSNFESFAFSRIDSVIMFTQWKPDPLYSPTGVHYAIANEKYSVRWTGKVQAQFTEGYIFRICGATGYRLWIDGKLVIDSWMEKAGEDSYKDSAPINLVAGQLYDVKMECFNSAYPTNCCLSWKCASMDMFRLIPQAQLYPGAVATSAPAPAANVNPVANAGGDITITLPTNSTTLDGSGSSDGDGTIASYKWSKLSGPTQFTITNAAVAKTALTNLVEGVYVFQLLITDDKGATSTDTITVTVAPDPAASSTASNQLPVANAGADITITLPTNSTTLNGSASKDADGSIKAFRWLKISGPSQYTIADATAAITSLTNLVQGIYVFQLQVTDDKGAMHTDNVVVTVNGNISNSTLTTATLTLAVAPNPVVTNTRITVSSNVAGPITIRIYDRFGILTYSKSNLASNTTITVGDGSPSGTYIVEAIQGTLKRSVSVVKL
jgi:hypothetical protein